MFVGPSEYLPELARTVFYSVRGQVLAGLVHACHPGTIGGQQKVVLILRPFQLPILSLPWSWWGWGGWWGWWGWWWWWWWWRWRRMAVKSPSSCHRQDPWLCHHLAYRKVSSQWSRSSLRCPGGSAARDLTTRFTKGSELRRLPKLIFFMNPRAGEYPIQRHSHIASSKHSKTCTSASTILSRSLQIYPCVFNIYIDALRWNPVQLPWSQCKPNDIGHITEVVSWNTEWQPRPQMHRELAKAVSWSLWSGLRTRHPGKLEIR